MRCYVLMGVSGSGKSSVGEAVAARCGMTFIDGDDLHPAENVAKMAAGKPLEDADRAPWLAAVGETLARTEGPVVVACSALKRSYRDLIRARVPEPVGFLHLDADFDVLAERMAGRENHFMPPSLLESQCATLEGLGEDEIGARIDISQSFQNVVAQTERYVKEMGT